MVATVNRGKTIALGQIERVLENDRLPMLKKQKGFKEELALVNGDRCVGISVWNDRDVRRQYRRGVANGSFVR